MAEEKKTPKPRKPRAPKTQPAAVVPENVENIEKEVKEIIPVEPVLSEDVIDEPGDVGVLTPAEPEEQLLEKKPEVEATESEEETPAELEEQPEVLETELPEGTPTFREFQESLESSPVEIKKLNPNLPDSKSKWVAQIPYGNHSIHILFKGSYVKTLQAARNYNKARGFSSNVKEIRSN